MSLEISMVGPKHWLCKCYLIRCYFRHNVVCFSRAYGRTAFSWNWNMFWNNVCMSTFYWIEIWFQNKWNIDYLWIKVNHTVPRWPFFSQKHSNILHSVQFCSETTFHPNMIKDMNKFFMKTHIWQFYIANALYDMCNKTTRSCVVSTENSLFYSFCHCLFLIFPSFGASGRAWKHTYMILTP